MNLIERILAFFFPPRLPRERVSVTLSAELDDSGILWHGYDVRRTGIEKYWAEQDSRRKKFKLHRQQYDAQMRSAQIEISALEHELITQGYVNTIHDCWERE